jgi:hypothetical protein
MVVHVSVVVCPLTRLVGLAESVQAGALGPGGGGGVSETLAAQTACPAGPVTVRVYVVFAITFTKIDPASIGRMAPTP